LKIKKVIENEIMMMKEEAGQKVIEHLYDIQPKPTLGKHFYKKGNEPSNSSSILQGFPAIKITTKY